MFPPLGTFVALEHCPEILFPLCFHGFPFHINMYPSFTLLYFSSNIDLDPLLLTIDKLLVSSSCLASSCLFGTNPSHPWRLKFVPSPLFTVLNTIWAIPLLQCSDPTSSNLWDPNCNKGTAHKLRPSPTSEWTPSFQSFSQESNPHLDSCHWTLFCTHPDSALYGY